MFCYLISLVLSIFSIIMIFCLSFNGEMKFFGDTELYTCMAISAILIIIGFITDNRYKEDNYEQI